MTLALSFIINGTPVPSARVRKIPFHKGGGKLGVRGVTPEKSRAYMELVAWHATRAAQRCQEWAAVVSDKMCVRVQLHFVRREFRSDIDNLSKEVLDGLGQARCVFFNDNRVVQLLASICTDKKATERVEILVEPVVGLLDRPAWMHCAADAGWRPPT